MLISSSGRSLAYNEEVYVTKYITGWRFYGTYLYLEENKPERDNVTNYRPKPKVCAQSEQWQTPFLTVRKMKAIFFKIGEHVHECLAVKCEEYCERREVASVKTNCLARRSVG